MRIVANVSVKDEVDLIERTIAHLRAIGVDLIVACDMLSTDGTAEILERHAAGDELWLLRMSDEESQEVWARRNLELVKQARADWVIFLDADELPIPATGRIKDCPELRSKDVLRVDRFNVPLTADGPAIPARLEPRRYGELLLIADPLPSYGTQPHPDADTPWIRTRVVPKVMARPGPIQDVTLGAHKVITSDSADIRRARAKTLVTAHVPFTTRDRFARKVANIRAILSTHDELFGRRYGRHWRRWAALTDHAAVDEEFGRMILDAETLAEMRKRRVILSAAELFRERLSPPEPPECKRGTVPGLRSPGD